MRQTIYSHTNKFPKGNSHKHFPMQPKLQLFHCWSIASSSEFLFLFIYQILQDTQQQSSFFSCVVRASVRVSPPREFFIKIGSKKFAGLYMFNY